MLVIGAVIFFVSAASAQSPAARPGERYPAKSVRVIVGYSPGGATDILARTLSQKLSENLGQSFFVDNRPGASATIADAIVARSPADGYTLLAISSDFTITPAMYANLGYDQIRDFAPLSLLVQVPMVLIAHPALPVKSVKELIALARAKPGTLNAGSTGHGSSNHLAMELFSNSAGVKIVHVPYKGVVPAVTDLMGGYIQLFFGNLVSTMPYARAGKVRALATTGAKRSAAVPELSTVAEAGVPGYETMSWHGWMAPVGTPAEVVGKLNAELIRAAGSREIAEPLEKDGAEIVGNSPEQFSRHIAMEIARWRKVVKDAGLLVQ